MKLIFAAICYSFLLLPTGISQDSSADPALEEYHLFTPKQGNPIEAKLVNVSRDWREMEIVNRAGNSFSVAVNLVSLDDQQFVKDWIESQPSISDYSLEVRFEKKIELVDRKGSNAFAKLETREVSYDVNITNKSKETMKNPKVEYILLYENSMTISRDEDGGWDYTTLGRSIKGIKGELALSDLVYNRDQTQTTEPVKLNKVTVSATEMKREDDIVGAIVRVSTDQGEVVGSFTGGGVSMAKYTWESATQVLEGDGGFERERTRPERVIELTKKNSIEGPTTFNRRDVEISATVSPTGRGEGVIVAAGGTSNGLSLYVKGREVHLSQVIDEEVKTVSGPLPLGEFEVVGALKEEKLVLTINGRDTVEAESFGYFPIPAVSGIDVGEDLTPLEGHCVGPYEGPFTFMGGIRDCSIRFGESVWKRRVSDDDDDDDQ